MACAHIGPEPPRYAMCVPMMAQGETLGVLYLDSGRAIQKQTDTKLPPLSESQERMVKTLAEHLALAVANLNLREKLREQSIRDPLTDLFNRRYMEESLELELQRAARSQQTVGVIMLDVDHFKTINDLHGHGAGDAVLRQLGCFLKEQTRGGD